MCPRVPVNSSRRTFLRAGLGAAFVPGLVQGDSDAIRWEEPFDPWVGTPTVVGDRVYTNAWFGDTLLTVLDRHTGERHAAVTIDGVVNTTAVTTVVDGTAYVGGYRSDHAVLLAFDTQSLDERWRHELPTDRVFARIVVADGRAYHAAGDLAAVDVVTGERAWVSTAVSIEQSAPVVTPSAVYVIGADDVLYGLDRTDGSVVWRRAVGDVLAHNAPTYGYGRLYVGTTTGQLIAVDATDGTVEWTAETGYGMMATPLVGNGVVIVSSQQGHVYCFDAASGDRRWRMERFDPVRAYLPTIVGGAVCMFSGDPDAAAYLVDLDSGSREHLVTLEGSPLGMAPIVVDGVVYVPVLRGDGRSDLSGALYAIDLPIDGSSDEARVHLGTYGHHDSWTGDTGAGVDRLGEDGPLGVATGSTIAASGILGAGYLAWKHRRHVGGTVTGPDRE